jgi:cytochrome b561
MGNADAIDETSSHYDLPTIWLHWITVALVAVLWIIGQTGDLFPRGAIRNSVWSIHVVIGLCLGFVLVLRIGWRVRFGRILPPVDAGILHVIAKVTHYALYLFLAITVILGIANALYRGFNMFGIWTLPRVGSADDAMRHSLNEWHGLAANLLMLIALLHAAAALIHHYLWRDRVMKRMTL